MFQVKEINKAPFEDAERVFETNHPECVPWRACLWAHSR